MSKKKRKEDKEYLNEILLGKKMIEYLRDNLSEDAFDAVALAFKQLKSEFTLEYDLCCSPRVSCICDLSMLSQQDAELFIRKQKAIHEELITHGEIDVNYEMENGEENRVFCKLISSSIRTSRNNIFMISSEVSNFVAEPIIAALNSEINTKERDERMEMVADAIWGLFE